MQYFNLNKDYNFQQIESYSNKENFTLTELGGLTIGKSFIVLDHNDRDLTISFILTGYNSALGNLYTCVYSDLK